MGAPKYKTEASRFRSPTRPVPARLMGHRNQGALAATFGSENITVNGITVAPIVSYKGQNASASLWTATVGLDLSLAGTGTAPTPNVATPFASYPTGVTFNAGQSYRTATVQGNLDTDDFIIEALFKANYTAGTQQLFGSRVGLGWSLQQTSATICRFVLSDGTSNATPVLTVSAGNWYYALLFVDHSDGATAFRLYSNGSFLMTGAVPANNLNSASGFAIGAMPDTNSKSSNTVALARAWRKANWFAGGATNTSQWNAIAAARYAAL